MSVNLNASETQQLEAIDDQVDYHFSLSVKDHFNKIGKIQDFAAAPTPNEIQEQKALIKTLFNTGDPQASVKILDLFIAAARRVGDDKDLAAFLPQKTFTESDAQLLEKCDCKDYAALVRLSI